MYIEKPSFPLAVSLQKDIERLFLYSQEDTGGAKNFCVKFLLFPSCQQPVIDNNLTLANYMEPTALSLWLPRDY
jgi:hypothetical protein